MARRPRTHVPGGYYHVILRGNSRRAIFYDATDRMQWQSFLQDGLNLHGARIHAYCWMTNHVHMAVQVGEEPLGRFVGTVATRYAKAFNKKYSRSGHLFERRHRAIMIRQDSHFMELVRYIHRNPLRANMVQDLDDYGWSSHIAYAGDICPEFLTTSFVRGLLDTASNFRPQRYLDFMRATPEPSVIRLISTEPGAEERPVGESKAQSGLRSVAQSTANRETLAQLIARLADEHGYSEFELACPGRNRHTTHVRALIALEATKRGLATVSELADRFGRSQPALSRAVNKLRRQGN